jgi:hypothetical protein
MTTKVEITNPAENRHLLLVQEVTLDNKRRPLPVAPTSRTLQRGETMVATLWGTKTLMISEVPAEEAEDVAPAPEAPPPEPPAEARRKG